MIKRLIFISIFVSLLIPNNNFLMALGSPTINDIEPLDNVIPGYTRIKISGIDFGTASESWTTKSSITISDIDIPKAYWTDKIISFTAPEELAKTYKSGQKNSNQVFVSININGNILRSLPIILAYESVNPPYNDQYLYKQHYLYSIKAFDGWNMKDSGNNVIVAIIDDGIYVNHPDLRQNIWTNNREIIGNNKDDDNNGYVDDYYGWDFVSNTREMTTYGDHGTMVAGIIGAIKNNNIGIIGIASGVKLMPVIACNSKGCNTDAVTKAIKYAVDNGANIINLSLGTTGVTTYTDAYNDAIKYAYNKNVLIVASAGNGDTQGQIGQNLIQIPVSPVCNDNDNNMVLGVSGVDSEGVYLNWANYGKCVDVVAPASDIFSTSIPDSSDSFYSTKSGTSFSAPIVSGLAALIKSKYPTIKNFEIINLIKENAENKKEYNNSLGNGLININKTLKATFTPSSNIITNNITSIVSTTTDTKIKNNLSQSTTTQTSNNRIENISTSSNIQLKNNNLTQPTSTKNIEINDQISNDIKTQNNKPLYIIIILLTSIIILMTLFYIAKIKK